MAKVRFGRTIGRNQIYMIWLWAICLDALLDQDYEGTSETITDLLALKNQLGIRFCKKSDEGMIQDVEDICNRLIADMS